MTYIPHYLVTYITYIHSYYPQNEQFQQLSSRALTSVFGNKRITDITVRDSKHLTHMSAFAYNTIFTDLNWAFIPNRKGYYRYDYPRFILLLILVSLSRLSIQVTGYLISQLKAHVQVLPTCVSSDHKVGCGHYFWMCAGLLDTLHNYGGISPQCTVKNKRNTKTGLFLFKQKPSLPIPLMSLNCCNCHQNWDLCILY